MTPTQVAILLGYDEDPDDPAVIDRDGPRDPRGPAPNLGTGRPGYCKHNRLAPQCPDCRREWAQEIQVSEPVVTPAESVPGERKRRVRTIV